VACNLERSKNLVRLIRMKGSSIGQRSTARIEGMLDRLRILSETPETLRDLHALFTWIVDSTIQVCSLVSDEFFEPAAPHSQVQRQS